MLPPKFGYSAVNFYLAKKNNFICTLSKYYATTMRDTDHNGS